MISPDAPCFTVLPTGGLCGHPFRQHFGQGGTCIRGTSGGEASVCPCLAWSSESAPIVMMAGA